MNERKKERERLDGSKERGGRERERERERGRAGSTSTRASLSE